MRNSNQPGMLAAAIRGFNRTWTAVTSVRDSKDRLVGYQFTCGCGESKFVKERGHVDSRAVATGLVDSHRCPPSKNAARIMHKIARAA
jgi:hypothetical protein